MPNLALQNLTGAADGITQSFLSQIYPAIASAIEMPIYFIAVIYWALFGYKIYAGYAPLQWHVLLAKTVMTVAVFSTLNWNGFAQDLYKIFVSFMESTAATIMAGKPTAQMVDSLYEAVAQATTRLRNANIYEIAMILDGLLLFIVNCILFILVLFYMTMAKFGLAITMVLCPLFIGFLMFAETRQWFINWLSKMLNFALIYILAVALISLGFRAFGHAINTAAPGWVNTQNTAELIILEGVLIIFLLQIKSWAAALSGGVSVQGVSLLMRAMRGIPRGR